MTCQGLRIVGSNSSNISASSSGRPPEICVKLKRRKKYAKIDVTTSLVFLLLICHLSDTRMLNGVSASSPPKAPLELMEGKLEKACDKSRIVLTEEHGFISSGPEFSNYTQNSHCEWLIRPLLPPRTKNGSQEAKVENILSDSIKVSS